MNALTMKNAQALAIEYVTAQGVRDSVTAILNSAYIAHVDGDKQATKYIVTFWGCVASRDKKALATLRSLFNRVTKAVNKEKGISEKACTVKDGAIVEVTPRVKKGAAGGGEGGEGEGSESANTKPVKDDASAPRYSVAFQELTRMLKREKDQKKREALEVALTLLAPKC
jgi:hypothetical protein